MTDYRKNLYSRAAEKKRSIFVRFEVIYDRYGNSMYKIVSCQCELSRSIRIYNSVGFYKKSEEDVKDNEEIVQYRPEYYATTTQY